MAKPNSKPSEKDMQRARTLRLLNDLRMQPLKSLPMTLFLMWMVGNDVGIFTIMFVGMAVVNPLQSIFGTNDVFKEFEEEAKGDANIRSALSHSKLMYIASCLLAFAVALVKLSWMGLMPVNAMDWLDSTPPDYKEYTQGFFAI
ncbi:hypothetical protein C3747_41g1320c [Trypanosoma cruzi]|uniref:ER membrane protein complex subunit 4 n=2 Tax=Trypanosoma cruzi TaxID=5693 RepID=Q4E0U6_TRYCC|nr:hypothetical protein, conserved [Trypanosoma cruzi]EAN98380.1 hypothetical protein, conserved [Trypanosoma cruzi]KAF8295287.1 putative Protein of unknown function (DUF1077) [Trypanosoma cruzi]PWV13721.1 hypothetical protein C3747_41g1320c [Trypanosoma cruzi]RNC52490.1 ER membrane DUF1077 domain-containing protein [Trypanosoma cruzi]|eukprot:XP_820231.1 hypothetical protein [Trypanosoma cruzi strain CL Brener]